MKTLYLIVGLVIVVGVGFLVLGRGGNETANLIDKTGDGAAVEGGAAVQETIITFTDGGYTPKEVTIRKGDTVTWKNNSSADMWTATAIHPTHRVYPGSDIEKCGTAEGAGMFDACRGIPTGNSYSFTFNEVGTWKYHDHLNLGKFGTIVVEE